MTDQTTDPVRAALESREEAVTYESYAAEARAQARTEKAEEVVYEGDPEGVAIDVLARKILTTQGKTSYDAHDYLIACSEARERLTLRMRKEAS